MKGLPVTIYDKGKCKDRTPDFVLENEGKLIYLEIKYYISAGGIEGKVRNACRQLVSMAGEQGAILVLIVGNLLNDTVKSECLREYNVHLICAVRSSMVSSMNFMIH